MTNALKTPCNALFSCDIPKLVWNFWASKPDILDGRQMDVIEVALQVIRNGTQKDLEMLFVTTWYIWFNRNQVVHESISTPLVRYGILP